MTTEHMLPKGAQRGFRSTAKQRLARRVKVDPLSGCHVWQASVDSKGYGQINIGGRLYRAHRLAWIVTNGPITRNKVVCHRCDVRRCLNPDHLFLDTQAGNMADMKSKWRERRRLGLTHFRSKGGLPVDARPAEIAPIRIICGGFELLGDVVVRPIRPGAPDSAAAMPGPAATPELAPARRPGRRGSRDGRSGRRSSARSTGTRCR